MENATRNPKYDMSELFGTASDGLRTILCNSEFGPDQILGASPRYLHNLGLS